MTIPRWIRLLGVGLAVLALCLLALAMGSLTASQPLVPLAIAALVLALGLSAADSAALPLLSMAALVVGRRASLGPVDLSWSDLLLFVGALAALVLAPRPFSAPLRTLLWLCAFYQFTTLFTVVANPSLTNVVEWVHAAMLVGGALLVGWSVGAAGHARLGLALFIAGCLVIAWSTIGQGLLQYARGDFAPVYTAWPFGMHKNFAGNLLCFGALVAFINPGWLAWRGAFARLAFWSCAAGVMVTQSRQAIIALGVAIVFIAWRERRVRNRVGLVLLGAIPAMAFALTLVQDQVESGNEFNSVFQRLTWFEDTIAAWVEAPWFGYGLRFWYKESSPLNFQPPNAELEVLASAGVVGLLGFAVLFVGALVVLGRLDHRYGTLALTLVLARVIQGQFDLFWVATQVSIPFAVAGVCLGIGSAHGYLEMRSVPLGFTDVGSELM